MIGHSEKPSESWKNLKWKKFRRELFRLQVRLFKAVQAGDKRKAWAKPQGKNIGSWVR